MKPLGWVGWWCLLYQGVVLNWGRGGGCVLIMERQPQWTLTSHSRIYNLAVCFLQPSTCPSIQPPSPLATSQHTMLLNHSIFWFLPSKSLQSPLAACQASVRTGTAANLGDGEKCALRYICFCNHPAPMQRSYHAESTGSHQNSEVKLRWAGLVLC